MEASYSAIINNYLHVNLDGINLFFKVPANGALQTKKIEDCKNLSSSYENQKQLFHKLIVMLRDPSKKAAQPIDQEAEHSQKKAIIIFNRALQNANFTMSERIKLAEELRQHMNENLSASQESIEQKIKAIVKKPFENFRKQVASGQVVKLSSPKSKRPSISSIAWEKKSVTSIHERKRSKSIEKVEMAAEDSLPKKQHDRKRSSLDETKLRAAQKDLISLDSILSSPRGRLGSRENLKLQLTLPQKEEQFMKLVSSFDLNAINSFLNYWRKSDLSGVQKLIKENRLLKKQFIKLTNTPLMRLLLQEQTVRMLQVLPTNLSTWSLNLTRQGEYITRVGQKTANSSNEIECFGNLLENVLDDLRLGNPLIQKSMIIEAWRGIVLQTENKDSPNFGSRCCEIFLDKLITQKLFPLEKIDPKIRDDLGKLQITLAHVLHGFGQDAYVNPSIEVKNLFKGYECKYRPGVTGRYLKYSIKPSGNLRVETTIIMDFSKDGAPSFSMVLQNTLETSIRTLPDDWKSRIKLQVITEKKEDLRSIEDDVLVHLSRHGLEADASSFEK